jgi:ABC-type transport system involved in cytochrome c biogenesis permease subunit
MKKLLPLSILALGVIYLGLSLFPLTPRKDFDFDGFGRLPVLLNGRVKPMDTVARTTLLMLQGRQRVSTPDGHTLTPTEWLLDTLYRPKLADTYQTFEIAHPDVLALFALVPEEGAGKKRFSFNQLQPRLSELDKQARLIMDAERQAQEAGREPPKRTTFQRAVLELRSHIVLYDRLTASLVHPGSADFLAEIIRFQNGLAAGRVAVRAREAGQPHDEAAAKATLDTAERFGFMAENGYLNAIPPADGDLAHWHNSGTVLIESIGDGEATGFASRTAIVQLYAALGRAWAAQTPSTFNEGVRTYRSTVLQRILGERLAKADLETRFNAAQPFYHGMVLFVGTFLLAVGSWLFWREALGRAAFWLLGLTWVLTTAGILARMWLEGRPPVTNLYSSALFIGWGSVAICLVLEKFFRNGVGSVAGGLVGFATLIIAHHLSLSGDTLEMMQAVLDSNFWLATHVVIVTLGYAATFVAGFLALIYVYCGVFSQVLDKPMGDTLAKMLYGIVCFATLFSFVGTVLGGIWADQSWGRFWGWDPKENGALIIVLWNALILHARWGGLVKRRGLMALAIFGNIVTAWSWFGVNMLGVGLHSYGFMDSAVFWLTVFVISQLALIGLAVAPGVKWRSNDVYGTSVLLTRHAVAQGVMLNSDSVANLDPSIEAQKATWLARMMPKIETRDIALKLVKDTSMLFFGLAAFQGIIGAIFTPFLLIDALIDTFLAALLWTSKSRVVAVILLLWSVGNVIVTTLSLFGIFEHSPKNVWLAVLFFLASINGVKATFLLHGKFAKIPPANGD